MTLGALGDTGSSKSECLSLALVATCATLGSEETLAPVPKGRQKSKGRREPKEREERGAAHFFFFSFFPVDAVYSHLMHDMHAM